MTPPSAPPSEAERGGATGPDLLARFGELPPLWAHSPRIHPMHIHWRMGEGESYRYAYADWAASLAWSPEQRIAYVRRWDPPYSWLSSVAAFLWPEDFADDDEPSEDHFARMEALGFGTEADHRRCFAAGPDDYPLPDDVCARWLDLRG